MKSFIVADASPLIGLARIDSLALLRSLYGTVLIPAQVFDELRINEVRPGNPNLRQAMDEGWLGAAQVKKGASLSALNHVLDPGEAAAILLAERLEARFLLIDERRGRRLAQERGVRVVGTGGILLAAKQRGLIDRVELILDQLAASNYWMTDRLKERILDLAGE